MTHTHHVSLSPPHTFTLARRLSGGVQKCSPPPATLSLSTVFPAAIQPEPASDLSPVSARPLPPPPYPRVPPGPLHQPGPWLQEPILCARPGKDAWPRVCASGGAGREGNRTGWSGAAGVGTLASTRGSTDTTLRYSGYRYSRATPLECTWSPPQSSLVLPLGNWGLDAENSEGTPVPRKTAPGAQAADGSGPWGAVSNQGEWVPGEEPWLGGRNASGQGDARPGHRGPLAELCPHSEGVCYWVMPR